MQGGTSCPATALGRSEQLANCFFDLRPHGASRHHMVGGIEHERLSGSRVDVVLGRLAAPVRDLWPAVVRVIENVVHVCGIWVHAHADSS